MHNSHISQSSHSGPKLFIALPVYRELDALFTQCLLRLITDPPVPIMLRMCPGDSLVSRARNGLTADFLASDATHLLFIDTDLIFSNDHVARIVSHNEPVVGGFYPKKQEGDLAWVCNTYSELKPIREDGLQELRYTGTGFMCIQRQVFERMIQAHPELAYHPDHDQTKVEHDFWSVGVYRAAGAMAAPQAPPCFPSPGRYLSEDWFFCQRWLDLGGKVFGDTRIILKHVGQAVYPLSYQQPQISRPELVEGLEETPGAGSRIAPAPAPAISRDDQSDPPNPSDALSASALHAPRSTLP